MAHINTFNNQPGAIFADHSINVNAQQNNTQVSMQPHVDGDKEELSHKDNKSTPIIRFNRKKGNLVNLFRVIEAMRVHGFFKDAHGGSADQNDVFAAFGQMLGEDFSEYTRDLSQGKVHNAGSTVSGDIFDILKQEFLDSINEEC